MDQLSIRITQRAASITAWKAAVCRFNSEATSER